MSKYKLYHTTVKTSYALGIQNQVLPDNFIRSIPRSTTHNWKGLSAKKFVGSEFASQVETNLEQTQRFLDKRLTTLRLSFDAFARLYFFVLDSVGKKNFQKIVKNNKDLVVRLVDNFPLEVNQQMVCKFLQISEHQFNIWKNNQKYKCPFSPIGYCRKRFSNQISDKELNVLKNMMSQSYFSKWSISSVWGYAFKHGFISMSRSSWYRYCKSFGFSKSKESKKTKSRKREPIKTDKPNEIWHMDVTEFVTYDNVRFYVHSVLDNFSRKVLAYTISRDKSAKTRIISLKCALQKVTNQNLVDENEVLQLIADGGSENNNSRVRNVLRHAEINVNLIIARKDISQSNSVIEGSFKIYKQYLKKFDRIYACEFENTSHQFFHNYNNIFLHYKHEMHTPDDVYDTPELSDVRPIIERSNQQRIEDNRNSCCRD